MLIATFNCNSVRKRLEHILAWLATHQPDVLALQETKATDADFPAAPLQDAGWHVVFRGEKTFNGVAVITRRPPDAVSFGLGDDDGESETRFAHVTLGGVHILNTYVPQGSEMDSPKFQLKLEWFARFRRYVAARFDPAADRVVWVGDLNVAPTAADLYDPEGTWPHVCYSQPVIDAWQEVVDWGFVDVFRKHLPQPKVYTFWDYRLPAAVKRDLGWRIDHILATRPAADASRECTVDLQPRLAESPSDHTFVAARFEME